MSDKEKSLVPAGRSELATVAARANPLVTRGLGELQQRAAHTLSEIAQCDQNGPITYYVLGLDWYGKGDYEKASNILKKSIQLFDNAIQLNPSSAFAYRHRGKARWIKNVADETEYITSDEDGYVLAMKDFDEAIRLDPNNPLAYIERGEAWLWGYSESDVKELKDFDEAIRLDPNNAGWYALRGIAWADAKKHNKAIEDFREAIRLNSGNQPHVLIEFTKSEVNVPQFEDYKGGCPFLIACVRIDLCSRLADVYFSRGLERVEKDDHDQAGKDFDEAIRFGRRDAPAYYFRGYGQFEKREYDLAIDDFNEAIRSNSKEAFSEKGFIVSTYILRGRAWFAKRNYENAIQDYDEAIRLDPKKASAYFWRGVAWVRLGEYDYAVDDYDEAIRLDPKYANACASLAWVLATCPEKRLRDGKRAIQMATKACELTNWKWGFGLETLAAAYAEAGQFDEAERYQRKALERPEYRRTAGDDARRHLELYKQRQPLRESS